MDGNDLKLFPLPIPFFLFLPPTSHGEVGQCFVYIYIYIFIYTHTDIYATNEDDRLSSEPDKEGSKKLVVIVMMAPCTAPTPNRMSGSYYIADVRHDHARAIIATSAII